MVTKLFSEQSHSDMVVAAKEKTLICNAGSLDKMSMPTRVSRQQIEENKLTRVVVNLTTENLTRAAAAIEAWREAGVDVTIRLPITSVRPRVGNSSEPTCFGLDTEECYVYTRSGFVASDTLRKAVVDQFDDDRGITVEP